MDVLVSSVRSSRLVKAQAVENGLRYGEKVGALLKELCRDSHTYNYYLYEVLLIIKQTTKQRRKVIVRDCTYLPRFPWDLACKNNAF